MAVTSVASVTTAGGVQLLAPNGSRAGATITNTDANALYVLLDSGSVSATNYTVKLATDDYFEAPRGYKGEIKGLWAGDGSGAALMTEWNR